jgi:hypothetical protein
MEKQIPRRLTNTHERQNQRFVGALRRLVMTKIKGLSAPFDYAQGRL